VVKKREVQNIQQKETKSITEKSVMYRELKLEFGGRRRKGEERAAKTTCWDSVAVS